MYKQKISAILILFVYILITVSCKGNGKKSDKTEGPAEALRVEVSIGGMMCTGCEETIQNSVGKLDGIKSVKASYQTGNAVIEYFKGIVDTSMIKEAISSTGYTVKKFNPPVTEEGEK